MRYRIMPDPEQPLWLVGFNKEFGYDFKPGEFIAEDKVAEVKSKVEDFNHFHAGGEAIKLEKVFTCSMCGKVEKAENLALQHFAGLYCFRCAKKYKRKYSRICHICGQPLWKCTC